MNTLPQLWKKSGAPALCGAVALLTLLACVSSAAAAPAVKGKGVLGAIHAEKKAGNIDEGRAALYRLWAATDHKKLPPHIRQHHQAERGAANESSEIRCGTPILIDVLSKLHLMDPATRKLAEETLPDPSMQTPLAKTSGTAALSAPSAAVSAAKTRPFFSLPNLYETENFVYGWYDDLPNPDGSALVAPDDYTGEVPNVVLAWAKYFEHSFGKITADLGFSDAGMNGLKIPVALSSPEAQDPYDISSEFLGLTHLNTAVSVVPFIVLNYNFSGVDDNDDDEGKIKGIMRILAAHELLHVFHYLYAPYNWDYVSGSWWMETTATWVEDYVFDQVNDYVYLLSEWFKNPEWSLEVFTTSPRFDNDVLRQYGGVIFAKYLSEHFTGPDAIIDSWEFIRDTPTDNGPLFALDFIADSTVAGWTAEDLYLGFSGANATLDYEEGAIYELLNYIRSSDSLTITSSAVTLPEYLGATYLKDTVTVGGEQAFFYTSTNDNAADWGLGLVHVPWGAGYDVVLAKRHAAVTQVILADAAALDTLYGVPSFLDEIKPASSYATEHIDGAAQSVNTISPDTIALAATQVTTVDPMTIKVDWDSATDPDDDIGGYVVQYKPITEPDWTDISVVVSRTIYGDNSQAWLGGLVGEADYDVRVAAYDIYGNVGAFSDPITQTAGVAWPATDAELLSPPADPTPDPVPPSGGGGGGGGCFLGMLAPTVEIYGL